MQQHKPFCCCVCSSPDGGGAVRVQGAVPFLHGRRKGRSHLRVHHGRGSPGFHLPQVLVRTQCCQSERGCPGGLYGEWATPDSMRGPQEFTVHQHHLLPVPQLRYQKCLDARPPSLASCLPTPPADSVARRVRKGVQSLLGSFKSYRSGSQSP